MLFATVLYTILYHRTLCTLYATSTIPYTTLCCTFCSQDVARLRGRGRVSVARAQVVDDAATVHGHELPGSGLGFRVWDLGFRI